MINSSGKVLYCSILGFYFFLTAVWVKLKWTELGQDSDTFLELDQIRSTEPMKLAFRTNGSTQNLILPFLIDVHKFFPSMTSFITHTMIMEIKTSIVLYEIHSLVFDVWCGLKNSLKTQMIFLWNRDKNNYSISYRCKNKSHELFHFSTYKNRYL